LGHHSEEGENKTEGKDGFSSRGRSNDQIKYCFNQAFQIQMPATIHSTGNHQSVLSDGMLTSRFDKSINLKQTCNDSIISICTATCTLTLHLELGFQEIRFRPNFGEDKTDFGSIFYVCDDVAKMIWHAPIQKFNGQTNTPWSPFGYNAADLHHLASSKKCCHFMYPSWFKGICEVLRNRKDPTALEQLKAKVPNKSLASSSIASNSASNIFLRHLVW